MNRLSIMAIGLLCSGSLLLYTWFDWQAAYQERMQIQNEARDKLEKANELQRLTMQVRNHNVFFSKSDANKLIDTVERIKNEQRLNLTASFPNLPAGKKSYSARESKLRVNINQCTMEQIIKFVHALETQGNWLRLQSLEFRSQPPRTSTNDSERWNFDITFVHYISS